MSMEWLRANAPGFNNLSDEERSAIVDFSLLWSLFEARLLNTAGSANRLCAVVDSWHAAGTLDAGAYELELSYFRQRYYAEGTVTYHFYNLNCRRNDRVSLLRAVLDGSNNDPRDCLSAILIIIFRYRNNLFHGINLLHGIKWQYELAGQLGNFTNANRVLMKSLERHGQFV